MGKGLEQYFYNLDGQCVYHIYFQVMVPGCHLLVSEGKFTNAYPCICDRHCPVDRSVSIPDDWLTLD